MHTPYLIAFKENTLFLGNAEPFFDSLLLFWVGDPGAAISTGVGPGLIIGNAEEDVWALCHLDLSREIFWWFWWILVVLYYDIWVACANIGMREGKVRVLR